MNMKPFITICLLVFIATPLKAEVNERVRSLEEMGYEKLMVQLNKYKIRWNFSPLPSPQDWGDAQSRLCQ